MWIIEDNILGRWTTYFNHMYDTEQEAQVMLAKLVFDPEESCAGAGLRIVEVK